MGWLVYDLGGRGAAAGPTSEAAIATAEAIGAMPLRVRIGAATVDALELPAAALGLETEDAARWCRV